MSDTEGNTSILVVDDTPANIGFLRETRTPVIFMTELSAAQDKVRAFEAGANDYITRPFQHEEVVARVQTHLSLRHLEARVSAQTSALAAALAEVEQLKRRLQQEDRDHLLAIDRNLGLPAERSSPCAPTAQSPAVAVAQGNDHDSHASPLAHDSTPTSTDVLSLEAMERLHIISVLERTHGVIEGPKGAARLLNLKPSTARFRMRKLGINRVDYL